MIYFFVGYLVGFSVAALIARNALNEAKKDVQAKLAVIHKKLDEAGAGR